MKAITVYAVACKGGKVHEDGDFSMICPRKETIEDALLMASEWDDDCGPHRIVELREVGKAKSSPRGCRFAGVASACPIHERGSRCR